MAANDYYSGQSSQPYTRPQYLDPRPEASAHYPFNSSYSSSSIDQSRPSLISGADDRINGHETSSQPSRFSDTIPLKNNQTINTNQHDSRTHLNQYDNSPVSETAPPLLPSQKRIPQKKKGFFSGKIPWVVYVVSLAQITVFIVEIVQNSIVTGSPIMIHPQFNPMIGPSTYVQINMGARFVPCMRRVPGVQGVEPPVHWPCPRTTTSDPNDPSNQCDLAELCGFSGFNNDHPNQWFRFILPMFLHAGLIHIAFNLLLQLTMGREMEKAIGSIRFALVYFSSGIFGFVLGGNFAATAVASTGASGCLFGILALVLLDLIYTWNERRSPVKDLMWILVDIIISFVLGLLPGLDNFSHIGGFLMGIGAGVCILHSPNVLRQRVGESYNRSYRNFGSDPDVSNPKMSLIAGPLATAKPANVAAFAKEPINFFKGRKPLWWGWWFLRAGALIGVLVSFIVLLNNFYKYHDTCSWCKYLSCLPVSNWCEIGNLTFTDPNGTQTKRDLLDRGVVFVADLFTLDGTS
ncbi:uncharacterized protein A1O9_10954 [Exophiala aquamarina CBS 119918]|uniref:Rhomboid-type serine protease n=1 Tax=Exophiala aquamarina CBS 119918 TaxID=1182545 RepID=A0A072NZJ4_9EURO|nr:uncharacterized protein A1O9_10954 [Exophiala aquamarina CBS 119918]KEF53046.1 hypothetical protein A1O9_10954 [Exophiala aquamarina CBS 119918]